MPTELYERIVGELAAYRDTIEAVFMINYNEPTADKRFVDQVRAIKAAGLPPAVLTNGSGLTPDRVDALVEMGGLRFLSINLSTLDRERYRRDRGGDHLPLVLRNLAHARDKPLAETMDMAVLGTGDEDHKRDFEEISPALRRQPLRRQVLRGDGPRRLPADRPPAGEPATSGSAAARTSARGPCSTSTSRRGGPASSAARTTTRKYVVGDLTRESVDEVLTGPGLARMRRWAYGLEEAPAGLPLPRLHVRPHPAVLTRPERRCASRSSWSTITRPISPPRPSRPCGRISPAAASRSTGCWSTTAATRRDGPGSTACRSGGSIPAAISAMPAG